MCIGVGNYEKGGTVGDRGRECIREQGRQADRHKQNEGVVTAVTVVSLGHSLLVCFRVFLVLVLEGGHLEPTAYTCGMRLAKPTSTIIHLDLSTCPAFNLVDGSTTSHNHGFSLLNDVLASLGHTFSFMM